MRRGSSKRRHNSEVFRWHRSCYRPEQAARRGRFVRRPPRMRRSLRARLKVLTMAALAFAVCFALPAPASAQPMINFSLGGFIPAGSQTSSGIVTGRQFDDVLVNDSEFLDFNFKDFNGVTAGAELLVP